MKFTKKVLENGLTILHEKRDVPVSTVVFACKFGAAYESEKEKGIAHFIEHLCFKGTEKRNALQISSEIESVGGVLNAFTHEEITAYHAKVPSDNVNLALDVLSDVYFNAAFPEEEIKKEAKVICEEIKMYRDHPRAFVLDKLKESLYEKPFGMFIAGNEENIMSMNRNFLINKHREHYTLDNTILCVVGKNSFSDVLKFAKSLKINRTVSKKDLVAPIKRIKPFEDSRKGIEQANVCIGFHFPHNQNGRYSAEIFNSILGDGMSSKLFTEVREKRGLVYSVKSELDIGSHFGYLVIYAGTDKSKVKEVVKICVEEFKKMKDITQKELEDAKKQIVGNSKVESESSNETAINLIVEEILGDAKNYYNYEKNIRKITLKDIQVLSNIKEYSYSILVPD